MFRFVIIDPNVNIWKSEVYDETIEGHVYVWDYSANNYIRKHTWLKIKR